MRDGTQIAAEDWLQRHGDALYAYALRQVFDPATAEDMVQETLLAALRAQHAFRADSTERTWLIGILKHKCIDEIRRRTRASNGSEPFTADIEAEVFKSSGRWREPPAPWADEPLEQAQSHAFITALGSCLNGVPGAQRTSFVMRELQGLDATVASEHLGVTPNNLYVLLHRARLRLRRCLEKSGFMGEASR